MFEEKLKYDSYLEYSFLKWVLNHVFQLDAAQFIHPQHQIKVKDRKYKVDYAIVGKNIKIAIELDGFAYHSNKEVFTKDRLRQNDLQSMGWEIIRFSFDAIKHQVERCVEQMQDILLSDDELSEFVIINPDIKEPEMPINYVNSFMYFDQEFKPMNSIFDTFRNKLNQKTLRECQLSAFSELSKYYDSGKTNAACVMSVGAGKTALGVVACLAFTKKRAMIITPGSVIRGTFDNALNHENPKNVLYALKGGPLIPGCPPPSTLTLDRDEKAIRSVTKDELLNADIIVTNFHSLGTGEDPDDLLYKLKPDDIDMIVIDEAHIAASESYQRAFSYFKGAKSLLMSACFQRLDGKKIDADVVYRYLLIDSISDGHAKKPRVSRYEPEQEETTYEMIWPDGTRDEIVGKQELLEILKDEKKLARITAKSDTSIRKIMAQVKASLDKQTKLLYPVKPRVLFSALGEKHAEQISRIAQEFGIPCDYLHYSMTDSKKKSILNDFENDSGGLSAIVQLKMLGQGYDFPPITIVVPMRPYGSFSEFYQFIGRGIRAIYHHSLLDRVEPDKQFLDIIYHSELGLDDHIKTIYEENDMDPSEVHKLISHKHKKPEDLPGTKGNDVAEKPDTFVMFEKGSFIERIVHDKDRIEQRQQERREEYYAQKYSEYAQNEDSPVSFETYKEILKSIE